MNREEFKKRESSHSRYDKRLIFKAVKDIEKGMPHVEACRIYDVTRGTLGRWMRKYGSQYYHSEIKRRLYTPMEKREIVSKALQGGDLQGICRSYGLREVKILKHWIRLFERENSELYEKKSVKKIHPSKEKTTLSKGELLKALESAELKIQGLNTMIDLAEKELKISIRKKSGAGQSKK